MYLNIVTTQNLKRRQHQMMTPVEKFEKLVCGSKNYNILIYLILSLSHYQIGYYFLYVMHKM